ncbi:DUF4209 domain-containing protein [Dechloromonas sp.]|uniref:DUF4209 domain-containing protein n=1 Tax=Dechloromonas sp. TaxID=1917218 RepID=UPI00217454C4|nr:DUF4209 domain-containing protein [Dechloromonas sp.]MBU3696784.1 DUF4209 domain-containing protein [Dechloromonas sp.]
MALDWNYITEENLTNLELDALLGSATERTCNEYTMVISALLREEGRWSDAQATCLNFVQAVLSMMLQPSQPSEPYGPVFVMDGMRSAIPSDLPKEELKALLTWAMSLKDPELRARFLDVIWVQGREYRAAMESVGSYIESAIRLEHPEQWSSCFKRLERAVRLASSLGKGALDVKHQALSEAQQMLLRHNGSDPLYLSLSLIRLLLEFRYGEPAQYAQIARATAQAAEVVKNFRRANEYHLVGASAFRQAGETEQEAESLRSAAEALAGEAETALTDGRGVMAMTSILSDAVEAMRQAPGGKARADELHARLLEHQPQVLAEMQSFSTSIDSTELVNQALAAVENKSFRDAVDALCGFAKPPSLVSLKKQVEKEAQISVLGCLMSRDILNGRGKVVAIVPSLLNATDDINDPALRWRMFQSARLGRSISVQGLINPARRSINAIHAPDRHDVLSLIQHCPWIPPGHHESVARALVAGFQGDMLLVAHLVPVQFEAVIRHAIERAGGRTSILEPGGVQKESSLGVLLETPEAREAFGEAGVFELQDLLTEQLGANIRNEIAHGLMTDDAMFNYDVLYVWYLLLRCCVVTAKQALLIQQSTANSDAEHPGSVEGGDHVEQDDGTSDVTQAGCVQ